MSSVVLDSSALLACLNQEEGSEAVVDLVAGALLSTVNLAETISVLVRQGASKDKALEILQLWDFQVVDFERVLAEETGALIARTRATGLSLGDRACLALAKVRSLPAVTADRSWSGIDVGVQIQLIR
jgi:PIN domain nuclease of toxin-antitoxin system